MVISHSILVAHRGLEPENTLLAFRKAYAQGFIVAECDVWLTQDNYVVLCHDETLQRTAVSNNPLVTKPISSLKYDEIKQVLVGDNHHAEPLPLLENLLALIPAGCRLFVELKFQDIHKLDAFIEKIKPHLEKIMAISFYPTLLAALKKKLSDCKCLLLSTAERYQEDVIVVNDAESLANALLLLKQMKLEGIGFEYSKFLTSESLAQLPDGLITHLWYAKTSLEDSKVIVEAGIQAGIRFINVDAQEMLL